MAKQRNKLHYLLAIRAVQLALLIGLIISGSQVYLDLINERNNIGQFVDEMLKSSKEAATEAAYELDPYYSKTIVNGLVKYESIANITLYDDRKKTLAFAGIPTENIQSDWLSTLIVGNQHNYSIPLVRTKSDVPVGSISVTINAKKLSDSFLNRAKFIFLSGFFRSMALMLIFLILFYFILTRPLLKTIKEISMVNEANLDITFGSRLIKRKDELGELVEIFLNLLKRRQKAEAEAEKTKQQYFHQEKVAAFGQMAAGILHEIGNPIASMSGSTQHLLEINKDPDLSADEVRQETLYYLEIINEQTNRLTTLTKEIANYVSPQVFEPELVDLNLIIKNNKGLLRFDERLKNTQINYVLGIDLPAIYAIQSHVVQIFLNLLVNAEQACHACQNRTPQITVSTRLIQENNTNYVVLSIADNGIGMSKSVQQRALEPFFTTKEDGQGAGLGLSLCSSMVDEYGGKIDIVSSENLGTEVSVLFPVKDESVCSS